MVVSAAACAPAPNPNAVITPALLEHAPRYRLVFDQRSSEGVSAKVVDQAGLLLQEELAARGFLLAAPWETATVEFKYAVRDGFEAHQIASIRVGEPYSTCHTDTKEPDGCGRSTWDLVGFPTASVSSAIHGIAVQMRSVGGTAVSWHNVWVLQGRWPTGGPEMNRSLVRLVLQTLKPITTS
jgi:hypothetical protein